MRTIKLPNADDPILRRINGLRTLLDVLAEGSQPSAHLPGGSCVRQQDAGDSNPVRGTGYTPQPSFERMMALINRRRGKGCV